MDIAGLSVMGEVSDMGTSWIVFTKIRITKQGEDRKGVPIGRRY